MTTEQLKRMHEMRPFRPFNINFADGRSLPVLHPEFLARGGRTAIVMQPDESFEIIDLLLVTGLGIRNGARSRHKRG